MDHSIDFRPIRSSELSAIRMMMKDLYRSLGAPEDYMTDEKISATFQQLERSPEHLQLEVFEKDAVLVGYSLCFNYWYNEYGGLVLNIDELYVKPEFRGQGISTLYLQKCSERNKQYVAMSLEVLPQNTKAFELYKRIGFEAKETVMLSKGL